MKLRASRQKTWYPPEGKLVSDINKVSNKWSVGCNVRCGVMMQAWVRLEAAEHEREVALRKELMR